MIQSYDTIIMIDSCHHFKDKILEPPIPNVLASGRSIKMCDSIERGLGCPFPARCCQIKIWQDGEIILGYLAKRNETGFNKLSDFELLDPIYWNDDGTMQNQKIR
jgi:hypothetical protein